MFCPYCGTSNSDNALFCKNCGSSLASQPIVIENVETGSLDDTQVVETAVPVETQQSETSNDQSYQQQGGFQQVEYQPQANQQAPYQQTEYQPQANQQADYQPQGYTQADYQVKDYDQSYQSYQQQAYYQSYQQAYEKKPKVYSTNPVINAVKKTASSGIFLAGVICFSLYLVLTFFNLFSTSTQMSSILSVYELLGMPKSIYNDVQNMLYSMTGVIIFSGIIALIPTALSLLGSWLTFAAGKNKNTDQMSTSGLGIIKAITVLQLVFFCVGIGLSVILAIFSMILIAAGVISSSGRLLITNYDYGYSSYGSANVMDKAEVNVILPFLLVFIFIIVAALSVVYIIFYAKAIKTINCVKDSAEKGQITGSISMFVIVMLFINALSVMFSSVAGFACAAMYVLFAIALIMLRKEFKKLQFEQLQKDFANAQQINNSVQNVPPTNM